MRMVRRSQTRGFTLTELMIVVAIIGVLAMIAVTSYRKIITSSHVSEGTHMVNAIRVAHESYRAEAGTYVNISTSLDATLCPVHAAWATKVPWDPTCNGGKAQWRALPVHTDGPVLFGYATVAGRAGASLPTPPSGTAAQFGSASPTSDWFVVSGKTDLTDDGVFCTVVGTSWTNDIYVDKEGE